MSSTAKYGLAVVLVIVLAGTAWWWFGRAGSSPVVAGVGAHYVGRDVCASCHRQEHERFLQSHHHQALAVASAETVQGDFSDQTLEHDGLTSRFYRQGEKFMVRTEGPSGAVTDFEVRFVLAYHPLQQYMVQVVADLPPAPPPAARVADRVDPLAAEGLGALQVLRLCWDVDQRRWFYLRPEDVPEQLQPQDPLHWTGVTQRWNTSCAVCHSTNLQKNFDPQLAGFRTTFSEIDVSCESCHGPGSVHVQLAEQRWFRWDSELGTGLVSLKNATAQEQITVCAGCHSRRRLLDEDFHKTRQLADRLLYETLTEESYFVDGQIKDEVFVYGSYIQSKMYSKGIRCTDCHDPHSGKTYFPDNRLCTSCHQHPAGVYDSPQHHGHPGTGPGTRCVDCHMPDRHYMDVDPRRDHSLRIPRPDLSVSLGVPNACTGCHLEPANVPAEVRPQLTRYQDWQRLAGAGHVAVQQELQRVDRWAAEKFQTWRTQQGKPPLPEHFGEVLHAIRALSPLERQQANPSASEKLLKAAANRTLSPMYRVTALAEIADWSDEQSLQQALDLLRDDDPFVVYQATQRIEREIGRWLDYMNYGLPAPQGQPQVQRLCEPLIEALSHSTRLVRIRAASLLLNLPPPWREAWLGNQARRFATVLDEAIAVHLLNEEVAAVADIYQALGNDRRAEEYYRLALKHQPYVYGIRTNLALLMERRAGSLDEPQRAQIELLRQQDRQLLEVELERAGHLPTAGELHYRYAMAQYLQGNLPLVEKHLQIALERRPFDPTYLLGMTTYYKAIEQWDKAQETCRTLLQLDPRHPGYQSLWREAAARLQ
jgi:tetratricopeptide (TPR) repeat protein